LVRISVATNRDYVLVRYGELSLKGPVVRREFESILMRNISDCLDREGIEHEVSRVRGRILIKTARSREASAAISKVFGVVSSSPALSVRSELGEIREAVRHLAAERIGRETTFAIDTNRANKSFPLTSQEVNEELGDVVREERGGKVDLKNPSVTIGIDIRDRTYVFDERFRGPGGLPLGTSGRTISLLSGGIDSPVAAYLMMKRGCEQVLLYFDNDPFVGIDSRNRAVRVARILNSYACGATLKLLVAPHGHSLKAFVENCPRGLTCTLCKRMMVRVAGEVARREGCQAIVMGSSLSQVCSQTMENMVLTSSASSIPVLMPLIGTDKEDVIATAKRIGTYEESTRRVEPCGAVPRRPRTRPDLAEVQEAEENINVEGLVRESLEGLEVIDLS